MPKLIRMTANRRGALGGNRYRSFEAGQTYVESDTTGPPDTVSPFLAAQFLAAGEAVEVDADAAPAKDDDSAAAEAAEKAAAEAAEKAAAEAAEGETAPPPALSLEATAGGWYEIKRKGADGGPDEVLDKVQGKDAAEKRLAELSADDAPPTD